MTPASAIAAPMLVPAEWVAHETGLPVRSVWKRARKGDLPGCVRIGRLVRFRREAVLAWIAEGCPAPGGNS